MSAWVAPITWTSAQTVTASQMNGLRDNLTWLKGFADLITNSTSADTGTATYLNIERPNTTDYAYFASVNTDTYARYGVRADGRIEWGHGSGAADVNLYRSAADSLATDDTFVIGTNLYVTSFASFTEMAEPGSPPANTALFFCRDNGSGKTQLVAKFPSGGMVEIAVEP